MQRMMPEGEAYRHDALSQHKAKLQAEISCVAILRRPVGIAVRDEWGISVQASILCICDVVFHGSVFD